MAYRKSLVHSIVMPISEIATRASLSVPDTHEYLRFLVNRQKIMAFVDEGFVKLNG